MGRYVRQIMVPAVKRRYPNKKWAAKVDAMSDKQIIALYHRFAEEDQRKIRENDPLEKEKKPVAIQLNLLYN